MPQGTRVQDPTMPRPPNIKDYYGPDGKLQQREKNAYNGAVKAYQKAMAEWRKAQVAASTGTRSGSQWTGTIDNLVDETADVLEDWIPGGSKDAPMGDDRDDEAAVGAVLGDYNSDGRFDSSDVTSWARENPVAAGLVGVGVLGAIGVATGVIKLP